MAIPVGGILDKIHLHFGMKTIGEKIGEQLRKIRRSKIPEVTIEKLADLSGLSRQTIGAIEKGKKPKVAFANMIKIAKALDISVDDLVPSNFNLSEMIAEEPAVYKKKATTRGASAKGGNPRSTYRKAG